MKNRQGPDFISIGLQKTASNWLYFNLNQHRGVKPLPKKGIGFFYSLFLKHKHPIIGSLYLFFISLKEFFYREVRLVPLHIQFLRSDYDHTQIVVWREMMKTRMKFHFSLRKNKLWYESFFVKDDRLMGELSSNYSRLTDKEISLIKEYYPDLKVILILREPVDRFFSYIKSQFRDTKLTDRKVTALIEKTLNHEASVKPIDIVRKWSTHFDSSQLYIGFYDDIKNNPVDEYIKICGFLGLSTDLKTEYSLKVTYRGNIKSILGKRAKHSKSEQSAEAIISQYVNNSKTKIPNNDAKLAARIIQIHQEGIQTLNSEVESNVPFHWLQGYKELDQNNSMEN